MIKEIKNKAFKQIEAVGDKESLEQIRIKYLGRKGELTQILRDLKNLPLEKRRQLGPQAQQLKKELEEKIKQKFQNFKFQISNFKFQEFDITKPGKKISIGHLNPLTKIEEEIRQIFLSMSFSVVEGPEIETEYYNFDALNVPPDHPAREMQDTFWLKPESQKSKVKNQKLLLRTHTSPMQIHYMKNHEPPFQIIVPGRVFRYEASDFSHEINFNQIEGLMVGKDVSLSNFKFIIEELFERLFGKTIEFCYQSAYFPFTEPSVEVLIKFKGKWLEIMGAGMVHPAVFRAVGYDPYKWQGFAFGMCTERLAMIKYNIPDIRLFYSGDLRFINQF